MRLKVPDEVTDEKCELCGRNLVVKTSRFGKFLACPGYPECKFTKPITEKMPGRCPKCGSAILKRKSKRGYAYYACERGAACGFMTWDVPTDQDCPVCGQTMFKRSGGRNEAVLRESRVLELPAGGQARLPPQVHSLRRGARLRNPTPRLRPKPRRSRQRKRKPQRKRQRKSPPKRRLQRSLPRRRQRQKSPRPRSRLRKRPPKKTEPEDDLPF